MITVVGIVLFTLLAATALALVRVRNLFAVVMLAGVYSLLSAGLFTVMDAVDVAFTGGGGPAPASRRCSF